MASEHTGGWRTMESAPKDGTAVLLYVQAGATDYPYVAKWLEKNEHGDGPGWFLTWDHTGFDGDTLLPPTHWMPLPDPPAALALTAGETET